MDMSALASRLQVSAPVPSLSSSVASKKRQNQRWLNFGIIVDSDRCTSSDTTGFVDCGISAPIDNVQALRDKVHGPKAVRMTAKGFHDVVEQVSKELEPDQAEFFDLGSIEPEDTRKLGLALFLKEAGLSEEQIQEAVKIAFPEGDHFGLKFYRLPEAKAEEEGTKKFSFKRL